MLNDDQHDSRIPPARIRLNPCPRDGSCEIPRPSAGAHEFRGRLCSAPREFNGTAESPCLRPALRVKGLSERSNALIGQFELEKFRNVKCGVLSSGEQTRVALAKAMLKAFRCPMSTTKLLLGVVPRRGDS